LNIKILVSNVQHINKQEISFDLSKNKLLCIAGKNSVGKTTLIRAIRNLSINSTFQDTAAPYIFNENSKISYSVDGLAENIEFTYNKLLKSIDSKQEIPEELKSLISVELPIPHGERFNHFSRLSDIDEALRAKISIGDYSIPLDLISFLESVYGDSRFENLKQVDIKRVSYYFILKDEIERYYIREDYFSSGEYFVINLFKQIQQGKKLIVIDEIDISLDASAQVNLVRVLREYCDKYETNIVFTTHSLALMKTLNDEELHYMERNQDRDCVTVTSRSYNFVKSVMYGFTGFDKYILTEDKCLEEYMDYIISSSTNDNFFKHLIIYVAGGSQVVDLLSRNTDKKFLSESENVVAALDGDQSDERFIQDRNDILLLPFSSIEKAIYDCYLNGDDKIPRVDSIEGGNVSKKAKNLFWKLTKKVHTGVPLMSKASIYAYLEELNPGGVKEFRQQLTSFLNPDR
jgi:ABC-type dipeptide/oligopeptide/nickel transport system ATPase subunit